MLFQHTLSQVIARMKTQTRRVVKPGETALRGRCNRIEAVCANGREKWRVGRTYAVQPRRGAPQVARLLITRIRSEQVMRISTMDAIAEGFASRTDFLDIWRHIHGSDGIIHRVWVIEFEMLM